MRPHGGGGGGVAPPPPRGGGGVAPSPPTCAIGGGVAVEVGGGSPSRLHAIVMYFIGMCLYCIALNCVALKLHCVVLRRSVFRDRFREVTPFGFDVGQGTQGPWSIVL